MQVGCCQALTTVYSRCKCQKAPAERCTASVVPTGGGRPASGCQARSRFVLALQVPERARKVHSPRCLHRRRQACSLGRSSYQLCEKNRADALACMPLTPQPQPPPPKRPGHAAPPYAESCNLHVPGASQGIRQLVCLIRTPDLVDIYTFLPSIS